MSELRVEDMSHKLMVSDCSVMSMSLRVTELGKKLIFLNFLIQYS